MTPCRQKAGWCHAVCRAPVRSALSQGLKVLETWKKKRHMNACGIPCPHRPCQTAAKTSGMQPWSGWAKMGYTGLE